MTAIAPDNLAETLKDILAHLTRIEAGQQKLAVEIAELRGKVSQIPTWWQMLSMIAGMVLAVFFSAFGCGRMFREMP